jgi:histidine triad (HIT) family protein
MTLFSKIIRREIPCYKIAESDLFFAFLDIFPLVKGHVLVVSKTETDKFLHKDRNRGENRGELELKKELKS